MPGFRLNLADCAYHRVVVACFVGEPDASCDDVVTAVVPSAGVSGNLQVPLDRLSALVESLPKQLLRQDVVGGGRAAAGKGGLEKILCGREGFAACDPLREIREIREVGLEEDLGLLVGYRRGGRIRGLCLCAVSVLRSRHHLSGDAESLIRESFALLLVSFIQ